VRMAKDVSPVPVVAIGGLTEKTVGAAVAAGAAGVAVSSAVLKAPDPEAAVRALSEALERARFRG
jgi:thiamine-phosphate pyrophosphorylase